LDTDPPTEHNGEPWSAMRGERNLTLKTLERIADFLGVDPPKAA
jgi:hypothetical protein